MARETAAQNAPQFQGVGGSQNAPASLAPSDSPDVPLNSTVPSSKFAPAEAVGQVESSANDGQTQPQPAYNIQPDINQAPPSVLARNAAAKSGVANARSQINKTVPQNTVRRNEAAQSQQQQQPAQTTAAPPQKIQLQNGGFIERDENQEGLNQGETRYRDTDGETYVVNPADKEHPLRDESMAAILEKFPVKLVPKTRRFEISPDIAKVDLAQQVADKLSKKYNLPASDIVEYYKQFGFTDLGSGKPLPEDRLYGTDLTPTEEITIRHRDLKNIEDFSVKRRDALEKQALDIVASGREFTPEEKEFFKRNDLDPDSLAEKRSDEYQAALVKGKVAQEDFERFKSEELEKANGDKTVANLKASRRAGWIDDKQLQQGLDNYQSFRESVKNQLIEDEKSKNYLAYSVKSERDLKDAKINISDEQINKKIEDLKKYQLSDKETKQSENVGQFYNNLLGTYGSAALSGILSAGSSGLHLGAGILKTVGAGGAAQTLSKIGTQQALAASKMGDDSYTSHAIKLGGMVFDLPRLALVTSTPLGMVGGFAASGYLTSQGEGKSSIQSLKQAGKEAALGLVFEGAGAISKQIANKTFWKALPAETAAKITSELPENLKSLKSNLYDEALVSKELSNPVKRAVIASKIAGESSRVLGVGLGTLATEYASGANLKESGASAVEMVLFDFVMHHAHQAGESVSKGLDAIKGRFFDVVTGGKKERVFVDENNQVKDAVNVPDELVEGVVVGKDVLEQNQPALEAKEKSSEKFAVGDEVLIDGERKGTIAVDNGKNFGVDVEGTNSRELVRGNRLTKSGSSEKTETVQTPPQNVQESAETPLSSAPEDVQAASEDVQEIPQTNNQPPVADNSSSNEAKKTATSAEMKLQGIELKPRETSATDAAHDAATSPNNDLPEPTPAQKEAGNYKKGHININGLNISVENPVGSQRKGVDRDGKPWSVTMNQHYGYIKRTVGADEENIDVFIKDKTPADFSGDVFVVDQVHPDTGRFDEHKVMLGFSSEEEARKAYASNYAKDWKGLKGITAMPFDQFKDWAHGAEQSKPVASDKMSEKVDNLSTKQESPKENVADIFDQEFDKLFGPTYKEPKKFKFAPKRKTENESVATIKKNGNSSNAANKSITRNYRAGTNDASVTFDSELQRDLYDYYANERKKSTGGGQKAHQSRVKDLSAQKESLAKKLNIAPEKVFSVAREVADDVKTQMKGVKHLEERSVSDNVLPKFFDVAEKKTPVIKSIIGEKARMSSEMVQNLKIAAEMERGKNTPEEIYLATGWERGADGKFRYDLPDDAELNHQKLRKILLSGEGVFLPEVLKSPRLFKVYPELENVIVHFDKTDKNINAQFDAETGVITLSANYKYARALALSLKRGGGLSEDIFHEVQHAIQEIEGFSGGTSSKGKDWSDYWNKAGEVEARNAGRRLEMTAEKRKQTPISATEDVPRKSQILDEKPVKNVLKNISGEKKPPRIIEHNDVKVEVKALNIESNRLKEIQDKTIEDVAADPQDWIDKYYKKFGDKKINPDDAKKLFPEYNADPVLNVQGVHAASSALAQLIFKTRLKELPEGSRIVLAAGGAGSGKTWATEAINSDLSFDSVMRDINSNRDYIDLVSKSGHQGAIVFVLRDINDAARSNIERSIKERRVVPLDVLAKGHYESQQAFIKDTNEYAQENGFDVVYLKNISGERPQELTFEDFKNQAHNSYSEVLEKARKASYEEYDRNKESYDPRIPDALEGKSFGEVSSPLDGRNSRTGEDESGKNEPERGRFAPENSGEKITSSENSENPPDAGGGNNVLKRARTPEEIEQIKKLEGEDLGNLLPNLDAEVRPDGVSIELKTPESYEIFRRLIEDYEEKRTSHFGGIFADAAQVHAFRKTLSDALREISQPDYGYTKEEISRLQNLEKSLATAAENSLKNAGKQAVKVVFFDEAMPEESWHYESYVQAAVDEIEKRLPKETNDKISDFEIYSNAVGFHADYAGLPEATKVEEFVAKAATGQFDYLGIDVKNEEHLRQVSEVLLTWAEGYEKQNPDADLNKFAEVSEHARQIIKKYLESKRAKSAERGNQRADERSGNKSPFDQPGGKTEENSGINDEELSSGKNGKSSGTASERNEGQKERLKTRQTIISAENVGVIERDAVAGESRYYKEKSVNSNIRAAQEKIESSGLSRAVADSLTAPEKPNPEHTALQMETVNLLNRQASEAAETGNTAAARAKLEQAQEIVAKIAEQGTEMGQSIRQLAEWQKTDPEAVTGYVQKRRAQKNYKESLTPEESKSLRESAEKLQQANTAINDLQNKINDLERRLTEASKKENLDTKRGKSKPLNPVEKEIAKSLQKKSEEAIQRLKEKFAVPDVAKQVLKMAQPLSDARTSKLDAETLKDFSTVGADILLTGFKEKPISIHHFKSEMAGIFGSDIIPHLDEIHALSVKELKTIKSEAYRARAVEALRNIEGNEDLSIEDLDAIVQKRIDEQKDRAKLRRKHESEANKYFKEQENFAKLDDIPNFAKSLFKVADINHKEEIVGALLLETGQVKTADELSRKLRETFPELSPKEALNTASLAARARHLAHEDLRLEKLKLRKDLDKSKEEARKTKSERNEAQRQLLNRIRYLESPPPGYMARISRLYKSALVLALQTSVNNFVTAQAGRKLVHLSDLAEVAINKGLAKFGKEYDYKHSLSSGTRIRDILQIPDGDLGVAKGLQKYIKDAFVARSLANGVLDEFPTFFEKMFGSYASDIAVLRDGTDRKSLPDTALRGIEKVYEHVNFLNYVQEFLVRSQEFNYALQLRLGKRGLNVKDLIKDEKIVENITDEDLQFAVHRALKVSFAESPEKGTVSDKLLNLYLKDTPALLSPFFVTFPKFLYNATSFVTDYAPAIGLAKAGYKAIKTNDSFGQSLVKEVNPRVIGQQLVGSALFLATLALVRAAGDDDKWYYLKTPFKNAEGKNYYIDVRGYQPFASTVFLANKFNRALSGKNMFSDGDTAASETIEALTGLSTRNLTENKPLQIAGAVKTWAGDKIGYSEHDDKNWERLSYLFRQQLGEIGGGFLRPLKAVKDLVAQFDEREAEQPDLIDSPALQGISRSLPFSNRITGAESKKDFVTGKSSTQAAPGLKLFGVNLVNPDYHKEIPSKALTLMRDLTDRGDKPKDVLPESQRTAAVKGSLYRTMREAGDDKEKQKQVEEAIKRAEKEGILRPGQLDFIERKKGLTELEGLAKGAKLEDVERVYKMALDSEKSLLEPIIEKKKENRDGKEASELRKNSIRSAISEIQQLPKNERGAKTEERIKQLLKNGSIEKEDAKKIRIGINQEKSEALLDLDKADGDKFIEIFENAIAEAKDEKEKEKLIMKLRQKWGNSTSEKNKAKYKAALDHFTLKKQEPNNGFTGVR